MGGYKALLKRLDGWGKLLSDAASAAAGAGIGAYCQKAKSSPVGAVLGVVATSLAKGLVGEKGEATEETVKKVVKGTDSADETGKELGDSFGIW